MLLHAVSCFCCGVVFLYAVWCSCMQCGVFVCSVAFLYLEWCAVECIYFEVCSLEKILTSVPERVSEWKIIWIIWNQVG